jgi:AcrR family transcriptional regulator
VTERGERTRERLLDAAERLFAERGDGVSLREINSAAGGRNNAALHYHFRNREGLLRAIADRHLPVITARQLELFEAAERQGRGGDLRSMVEVIVRPSAEYLAAGPSARAWLRISTDLGTGPQTAAEDISAASGAAAWTAGARILEHLTRDCGLPVDFATQRIWTAMEGVMHALSNRARYEDAHEPRRSAPPLGLFVEDLLDMTCAALTAPLSDQTRAVLDGARHAEREALPN